MFGWTILQNHSIIFDYLKYMVKPYVNMIWSFVIYRIGRKLFGTLIIYI